MYQQYMLVSDCYIILCAERIQYICYIMGCLCAFVVICLQAAVGAKAKNVLQLNTQYKGVSWRYLL